MVDPQFSQKLKGKEQVEFFPVKGLRLLQLDSRPCDNILDLGNVNSKGTRTETWMSTSRLRANNKNFVFEK
jgi:hypothetical protein